MGSLAGTEDASGGLGRSWRCYAKARKPLRQPRTPPRSPPSPPIRPSAGSPLRRFAYTPARRFANPAGSPYADSPNAGSPHAGSPSCRSRQPAGSLGRRSSPGTPERRMKGWWAGRGGVRLVPCPPRSPAAPRRSVLGRFAASAATSPSSRLTSGTSGSAKGAEAGSGDVLPVRAAVRPPLSAPASLADRDAGLADTGSEPSSRSE